MSEYRGFRCDGCQKIIEDPDNRLKERTRFQSADGSVEDYFRDLCPDCGSTALTSARETKRQVPRRRRRKTSNSKALDLAKDDLSRQACA